MLNIFCVKLSIIYFFFQQENAKEEDNEQSAGKIKLEKWLNKSMKIKMTDGRTLIGIFFYVQKLIFIVCIFLERCPHGNNIYLFMQ